MAEEIVADLEALDTVARMKRVKASVKKLELLTLRKISREARLLAAECAFYEGVRLLQGGGKAQHAKQARAKK